MSIDKTENGYIIQCDGCYEELEVEGDFEDVLEALEAEEWLALKQGKRWEHFCRDCKNEGI